jgi:hypothetical protein
MKLAWIMLPAIAVIVPLSIWHDAPTLEEAKASGIESCVNVWSDKVGNTSQVANRMCGCIYGKAEKQGKLKRWATLASSKDELLGWIQQCSSEQGIVWPEG